MTNHDEKMLADVSDIKPIEVTGKLVFNDVGRRLEVTYAGTNITVTTRTCDDSRNYQLYLLGMPEDEILWKSNPIPISEERPRTWESSEDIGGYLRITASHISMSLGSFLSEPKRQEYLGWLVALCRSFGVSDIMNYLSAPRTHHVVSLVNPHLQIIRSSERRTFTTKWSYQSTITNAGKDYLVTNSLDLIETELPLMSDLAVLNILTPTV